MKWRKETKYLMVEENYEIVEMKRDHISKIVELGKICNLAQWTEEDYNEEILRDDSYALVCVENKNKKVIGFIVSRLIKNENIILENQNILENETEAEILNIAVSPTFQKQGIAQQIFDSFLKSCHANRIKNVWLEVRASNIRAKKFYVKNGFAEISKRKNYYTEPVEDAIVMNLKLNL